MQLTIDKIRTDGGTQPRAAIDFAAVDDYMDAMVGGVKFPAVTVFYDGSDYWLADGFHRITAAQQGGLDEIAADVHQGTREDAQWYSFGANKSNGLRRSNDDKQRAVKAALAHPKSAGMSDRMLADHVGVHYNTIAEHRKQLAPTITKGDSRTGRDGRTINTANIGKRKEEPGTRVNMSPERESEPEPAPVAQTEERPICGGKVAGSTPAGGSTIRTVPAPPKPEPRIDTDGQVVALLRAIYDLAEHEISSAVLISAVPDRNISEVYEKARAAWEFVGFAFETASKRLKKSMEVS